MLDSPVSDALNGLLDLAHLRTSVYANPKLCGRWRLDSKAHGTAVYHFVVRGSVWLHLTDGRPPLALRAGDLMVFPRDVAHTLAADSTLPAPDAPPEAIGPTTELICGEFRLDEPAAGLLLATLPDVLVIDGEANAAELAAVGRLLATEVSARQGSAGFGRQLVLDRLSDVLFVALLRHVVARRLVTSGVLAGLQDVGITQALAAMTNMPGKAWTVTQLAALAAMSRTAFMQRFHALVGDSPMVWLTRLRMARAADLLADPTISIAEIGARLGYRAEAAFRRAFKRQVGHAPGTYRRRLAPIPRRVENAGG